MRLKASATAFLAAILFILAPSAAHAQAEGPMVITPQPHPNGPYAAPPPSGQNTYDSGGPGQPYEPAPGQGAYVPPEAQSSDDGTFSAEEIKGAGHRFFGSVSMGLARVIEYAFQRAGRPNGYILGEEAGGAFVAGLRYGEGTLYTKDAGDHRVFWQGPSLGIDYGGNGTRAMMLVYDLPDVDTLYARYGGVSGSAYIVAGVGMTVLKSRDVILVPIRTGVGARLGVNVGYLKLTRAPTWNPF